MRDWFAKLDPGSSLWRTSQRYLVGGFQPFLETWPRSYDAVWDCVPAQAIGAPHRRDRVFIVAWAVPDTDRSKLRHRAEREPGRWHDIQREGCTELDHNGQPRPVAHTIGERVERGIGSQGPGAAPNQARARPKRDKGHAGHTHDRGSDLFHRSLEHATEWQPEPSVGRVANGIPRRVDRLRCLGNAVVPQVAEVIGRVVQAIDSRV